MRKRRYKPLSRKLVTSILTSTFVYLGVLALTSLGLKTNHNTASLISVAAGQVAGLVAGWLAREFPQVVSDGSEGEHTS